MSSQRYRRLIPAIGLTAVLLTSCGSDESSNSAPPSGGFTLGGFGSDLKNTVDKANFMKKAKAASQLVEKGRSKLTSIGSEYRSALSKNEPAVREFAALENSLGFSKLSTSNEPSEVSESDLGDDWGQVSEGDSRGQMDFGQSLGQVESCADAIRSIRQEYDNSLSLVKSQFDMLKQIDQVEAEKEGLKPISIPNRAIAYSFSEQGMTGTIEGAADESRILVTMSAQGQIDASDESSEGGRSCAEQPPVEDEDEFGDEDMTWPPVSSEDMNSSYPSDDQCGSSADTFGAFSTPELAFSSVDDKFQPSSMKMEVGFIANLQAEIIDVASTLETKTQEGSMNLQVEGRIAGGDAPELSQSVKVKLQSAESGQSASFNMSLSVAQVNESDLQIRIQSSGLDAGESKVPALNETILLKTQDDGSCSVVTR